jgi:hypothetical protein
MRFSRFEYPVGAIANFYFIRRDIHNFVFMVGINDTVDNLFTGVNDSGDKLSPMLLLPAKS